MDPETTKYTKQSIESAKYKDKIKPFLERKLSEYTKQVKKLKNRRKIVKVLYIIFIGIIGIM